MALSTPPIPIPERTSHPFVTHDMIFEIPATIRETLDRDRGRFRSAAEELRGRDSLFYTGCGTAFFAAMLGEDLLGVAPEQPIRSTSVPALELSISPGALDESAALIAVSHSGITKTTVDAIQAAKGRGARSIGITHFPDRPIADTADRTLVVGNGPDRSRCHTKCYVASAVACAALGLEVLGTRSEGRLRAIHAGLESLPGLVEQVLETSERDCEILAERFVSARALYFVGTGPNVPTAFEAALKIKETCFLPAEGMETEQILHGPWVALDGRTPVFVVAPSGPSRARAADLLRGARTLGVPTVALITKGDREMASLAEESFELPETDEYLSAFINIIPLYLFAYYSSVKRGYNPDVLRYLDPAYWAARQFIFPPGTH